MSTAVVEVKIRMAADWLVSGGEMGELIRRYDWSTSPIGTPDTWSPALRTTLRIMLANRFPHLVWWGPEFVQFYNDAYLPIPGTKHPNALGQRGEECWPEIWHVLRPLVETPFNGGAPTWDDDIFLEINRHGFLEECHFTIAYSPVPDEAALNGIGGVIATVHEITDKVIGERRTAILRELGAHLTEARTVEAACSDAAKTLDGHPKDVPFALVYLVDPDGRQARLRCASGVSGGQPISPLAIDLHDSSAAAWPLADVSNARGFRLVSELGARFSAVPPGPWSEPPNSAAILPIASHGSHEIAGFLVGGISSRVEFDESYRGFYDLLASQVGTAIASARAYEEEHKRVQALAELDRAKTAFFSNVSHEFRTPLTLILGPIRDMLAQEHDSLRAQDREALTLVHRNALRLLKLANTLLDFARIEAGRIQAAFQPTDLAAFTAELASVFQAATDRAGLRLVVDCKALPEQVYVDRDMWEKIVLNLISNAFKFTFEGEIEVAVRANGGKAMLTVRDTGEGIPAEEIPRLFERFHRIEGKRARTHEGTGIGLALVHELVKLHSGEIGVESKEGSGTTLTVAIPFGKSHLPEEKTRAVHTLASTATAGGAYVEEALRWLPDENEGGSVQPGAESGQEAGPVIGRVLLADDNADMRDYAARLLRGRFDVTAVADGEQALNAIRERRPDLVLADVMMPNLDGFGLLREIRSDPDLKTLAVVLLSARAGEEARVEGLEHGADDYLVKPFSARELVATVQAHVMSARIREESARAISALNEQLRRAMAETHHRVKNNLQVISAFVDILTMRHQMNVPVQELVRIGQHIRSLAALHDLLTERVKLDATADDISTKDVMIKLAPLVKMVAGERQVRFNIENIGVPLRQGTALAVLINELVSNAVKHGSGEIDVSLAVVNERANLAVSDHGPGFRESATGATTRSTGMEIIESVGRFDLMGEVTYGNRPDGGARVVVDFPLSRPVSGSVELVGPLGDGPH